MILHASLYSALLSTVTLNSVQNCCQIHAHRNWLPRSLPQLLDAASCSHVDNLRSTCLGHRVLQKVQLGESGQGGAGRKLRGDSHLLLALSQLTPPLPQSRKSIHVLSSVTSYYFWIGNPEEFLTEAWRKNKPLCFSPQDKHFQNNIKPEENWGSWGSQPTPASLLPCAGHPEQLSWQWHFSVQIFPLCPSRWSPALSATRDLIPVLSADPQCIPEVRITSLQPAPHRGAYIPPAMGQESPPTLSTVGAFLPNNAEKSVCVPPQLQQLWDSSLCHGRFVALHFPPDSPSWLDFQAAWLPGEAHCRVLVLWDWQGSCPFRWPLSFPGLGSLLYQLFVKSLDVVHVWVTIWFDVFDVLVIFKI